MGVDGSNSTTLIINIPEENEGCRVNLPTGWLMMTLSTSILYYFILDLFSSPHWNMFYIVLVGATSLTASSIMFTVLPLVRNSRLESRNLLKPIINCNIALKVCIPLVDWISFENLSTPLWYRISFFTVLFQ